MIGGVSFPASGVPIALELFAGTTALTKAFSDAFFIAIAVDGVENILMQRDFFCRLDLNDPAVQRMLLKFCAHPDLLFVHSTPPCGMGATASRPRSDRRAQAAASKVGGSSCGPARTHFSSPKVGSESHCSKCHF